MKQNTFGGYKTIDAFVKAKLQRFDAMERSFESLFTLMFSESENVLYERSQGYKILRTTYGEAREAICGRTAGLRKKLEAIPAGSVVGIHMQNSLQWIEIFWAVLRCGYRPLLMNLRLSDAMLETALADCEAKAVISDGKVFSVPTVMEQEIPVLTGEDAAGACGTEILLMSSGTSASLKICAYTAEEFYYQVHDSFEIIRTCAQMKKHYEGQLKLLTFLPFYHVFGLVAVYIWFAFFSRTFVQLNDLAPQTILNTIRRHKVTHIFAVPLFWEKVYQQAVKTIRDRGEATWDRFNRGLRLAKKLGDVPLLGNWFCKTAFREVRDNLFGESICFMITGGSCIGAPVLEFFNSIGYHLANGYGMTELGITSVELSRSRRLRNAGFVGKPLSSVEYRISESGELWVRGKTVAHTVMEHRTVTPGGDWFNTRDLAVCQKGRYRILGRSDDLIVAATGENLNPNLIEGQLELPGTRGVCLVAGETPTLLISVSRSLRQETLNRLEAAFRQRLQELQLAGQIRKLLFITDPLMLEQEFKRNRRHLAEDLAAGRLHPVEPVQTEAVQTGDPLWLQIRDMFAAALNKAPEEVSSEGDFFLDEGGSSLDYFAMLSQMQEEFAVSIPMESEQNLHSLSTLYAYIKEAVDHAD